MRIGRLSLWFVLAVFAGLFVGTVFAGDGGLPPVLPKEFGGWQMTEPPQTSKDPAAADPSNPALLKEYGFTDLSSATYRRDGGRKLTVKAARFADATGAYGAFTFYRMPQMIA